MPFRVERSGYAIPLAKGTLKSFYTIPFKVARGAKKEARQRDNEMRKEREKGLMEPHWWNSFD
ncbi:unnamed protein product [Lactuca saligna]|uniref:Uncharacterized protein n=1 Tax=Lactuca saligna TaxID=75948 RepID=A0AA35V4M8_LACSI|nr:unnamed protein product [Lactuca saligna]